MRKRLTLILPIALYSLLIISCDIQQETKIEKIEIKDSQWKPKSTVIPEPEATIWNFIDSLIKQESIHNNREYADEYIYEEDAEQIIHLRNAVEKYLENNKITWASLMYSNRESFQIQVIREEDKAVSELKIGEYIYSLGIERNNVSEHWKVISISIIQS